MTKLTLTQLIDLEKIRVLLEAHYKITGICSGILDLNHNILVAEGWQEICTQFHRRHPVTCARCLESNVLLSSGLLEQEGSCRESKCKNGLWDVAMPIIVGSRHLATFFTGQFFYDDDEVDEQFFRAQAVEFGFDEEDYISALRGVPIFTREQVRNFMDFYRSLVSIMVETGQNNLDLVREIVERKQIEDSLQESKDFLGKIINSISNPIFVKDRDHRLILANDSECGLAGRSREEILGRTDYDFFPKEQVDVFWEKDEIVFETGQENINEEEITDARGEKRVIVTKKSLYKDKDGKKYIVGIISDITERKRMESELKESEARYRHNSNLLASILESSSSVSVYALDREYRYLSFNRRHREGAKRVWGADIVVGMRILDAINTEEHREFCRQGFDRVLAGSSYSVESREVVVKDGRQTYEYRDNYGSPIFNDNGDVVGLTVFAADITTRKQTEERLALINYALDHVHEAAFLIDAKGCFHYVNEESCRALGYDRDELLAMTVADVDPDFPLYSWSEQWRAIKEDGPRTFEARHRAKNGRIFPVEVSANYFEHGGMGYHLALARDITERKRTETALKEREMRYRDVFENVSDALYLLEVTEDGRFRNIEVNPALERSTGLSREEMIGRFVDETVSGDAAIAVVAKYRRCVEEGTVLEEEIKLDLPAGRRYFHSTLIPIRDDLGSIHRIAGITRDITERKRAEELLRKKMELETRLARLAEASPGAVMTFQLLPDGTARIPYASPRTEDLTGFRPEDLAHDVSGFRTAIHRDDIEAHLESIAESARTLRPWHHEFRIRHPAKGWIWIEGRSAPERQADGSIIWYGFLHDITSRKRRQAQEEIRLRIFELLAEGGDLTVILCHVVKYLELADPGFIGNIMLTDAEGEYLHPVCSLGIPEDYLSAVKKVKIGEGIGSCGTAARRGDTVIAEDLRTHPFWADYNRPALKAGLLTCWSEPIFGASGAVLGAISIYQRKPASPSGEVLELLRRACHLAAIAVERKRAEDALLQSEARYRSLFEESIDGVFISSVEGKFIDINLTGVRMFGYDTKEEVKRLDLARDVYANPEDRNRILKEVDTSGSGENEIFFRKKSGETMLVRYSIAVVRDAEGRITGYQGVIRDITEERRLEQELFKAKKMEIIGQLAGGVAHEVRNPLNAILSISEALFRERDIADNPEYFPYVQHIRTQVGRLSKLMTDLLDLGKPIRPGSIQSVPLSEVLTDTINLWNMTEPNRAHPVLFSGDDIVCGLMVNADSARLQQALLNLLDNAAQHSPAGSEIHLHIGKPVGQRVAIQVRDSGKGIAPEKLERVFDPFFTTRTGGTGLGLPLVKHFVESMGGEVRIRNNESPPGCTAEVILSMEAKEANRDVKVDGAVDAEFTGMGNELEETGDKDAKR